MTTWPVRAPLARNQVNATFADLRAQFTYAGAPGYNDQVAHGWGGGANTFNQSTTLWAQARHRLPYLVEQTGMSATWLHRAKLTSNAPCGSLTERFDQAVPVDSDYGGYTEDWGVADSDDWKGLFATYTSLGLMGDFLESAGLSRSRRCGRRLQPRDPLHR